MSADRSAATSDVMREFYAQPFTEPDGSRTWCVREYVYGPDFFSRQIISWHATREEASRLIVAYLERVEAAERVTERV